MEGPVTGYTNPRHFKPGTPEYIEAVSERARAVPNLVDAFIAAMVSEGRVIRHIPQWLNEQTGLDISYPRLREWAVGGRIVPDEVVVLMAQKAVPWILKEIGFGGGVLPEAVVRMLLVRAVPWAAAINVPHKPVKVFSAEEEDWIAASLLPPVLKDPTAPRKPRPAKKAAAKEKKGAKTATKAVAKTAVAKKPPAKTTTTKNVAKKAASKTRSR